MSSTQGYQGFQQFTDNAADLNSHELTIKRLLSRVATSIPAKVMAVNPGGTGIAGTVDVQPMVNQLGADGTTTPHGIIHGLPYFRSQAGSSAVIIDPVVGDIGLAHFAMRDVSGVIANRDISAPGSFRRHDWQDGFYSGGFLGQAVTQFVQIGADGITMTSPTAVTINAPKVAINSADVEITGTTLKHNGVNVGSTHDHGGVEAGGSVTGPPQ